jgi:hypothetical protein
MANGSMTPESVRSTIKSIECDNYNTQPSSKAFGRGKSAAKGKESSFHKPTKGKKHR